jgi:hypothetical protein
MLAPHRIDKRHALDILVLWGHHFMLRSSARFLAAAGPVVAEGMRSSAARETVAYGDKLRGNSCTPQS